MSKLLDREIARLENATTKRLAQKYNTALKSIRSELQAVYAKYGIDGKLSMEDMQKYSRLVNLEKSINKELGRISGVTTRNVKKLAASSFSTAYAVNEFIIASELKAAINIGKLPAKQVEAAAANDYTLIALNRNRQAVQNRIKSDIIQGIVQGKSYRDTAKLVKDSLEKNLNNADTIARTESHRAREAGTQTSYERAKEIGVQLKKQWVATLDGDTRDSHQSADGQTVDVDKPFTVDGQQLMYPGDPVGGAENVINCRCTQIPVIEGVRPNTRASKAGQIDASITYTEWQNR